MAFFDIVMIAVGLAMDACAVCVGAGTSGHLAHGRPAFRLWFHFGLFQFLMPVIGWFLGTAILPLIASVDHWVAFGLLAFVGSRMIRSGFDRDLPSHPHVDPSRGLTLVMLSIATSIDALAVGLSLAMLRVTIWYPSLLIGIITGALSYLGLRAGDRLGSIFGKRMEIAGGFILILIGLRILISHLTA